MSDDLQFSLAGDGADPDRVLLGVTVTPAGGCPRSMTLDIPSPASGALGPVVPAIIDRVAEFCRQGEYPLPHYY